MSDYSKQALQKVSEAASAVQINKFMEQETVRNLERLKQEIVAAEIGLS